MNHIVEPERKISVADSCDVFVAGGGIAGISAAIAAAREGAKVILAEKQCILGGLATAGIITIYLPLCDGKGRQVSFGIAEELLKLSIKHCVEDKYPEPWLEGGTLEEKAETRYEVQYNPHLFALEAEKLLKELGVKILYDTVICSVDMDSDRINAVIVENKSGRSAYEVKSVVDASGDADICKFSGAKTEISTSKNMLAAWYYALSKGEIKLNQLGALDVPERNEKEKVTPQKIAPKMRFSGIDGEEISMMLTLSHENMLKSILKNREKDENYVPINIPTMPQLRMTRMLSGEYTLCESEMHKHFDDSIGMISDWRKSGPVYEVPFKTLYGKEVKNLICAGRCISVTEKMWDISRVIPSCAVTGQAAGIAAAMSDDFKKTDVAELQKKLRNAGVILHESELKI